MTTDIFQLSIFVPKFAVLESANGDTLFMPSYILDLSGCHNTSNSLEVTQYHFFLILLVIHKSLSSSPVFCLTSVLLRS